MIYFTAHTFKCVCHCRRAMFRVLGMYNFASRAKSRNIFDGKELATMCQNRRSDMMTSILSISDFQIFFWLKFILRYYIFIGRPEKF